MINTIRIQIVYKLNRSSYLSYIIDSFPYTACLSGKEGSREPKGRQARAERKARSAALNTPQKPADW